MNFDNRAMPVQEEGIDIFVVWRVLKEYKVSIAICTLICVAGAALYAFTATPMFRAEVTIAEAHDSALGGNSGGQLGGQLGGLASLAGVTLGGGSAQSRDAQAILKSRRVAQLFIQRYDLTGKLLADSKGPKTLWNAVTVFKKRVVDVDEDRKNSVTTVSMYWSDPKEAAVWANNYVALSNEVIRNRAAEDARRNIDYLSEQLKQTSSVEVQHALYSLVESQTKTLMLAEKRAEYAFSVIDPAEPPELKSSPKKAIILLVAFAVGLLAAVLIALARDKVARSPRRAASG